MNKRSNIYYSVLAALVLFLSANFTGGTEKTGPIKPEFVELQEGAESISGKIYDEYNIIAVKEMSFTGHNKIGGIRRESDDSVNVLDLAKLKEIIIKKENYISPRYQDQEFILVETVSNNGARTKDLLVPKKIVICGISIESEMEKSWYLNKVNKIEINNTLNSYN